MSPLKTNCKSNKACQHARCMSLRVSNARYQESNHQNEWSFELTKMNNRLVIRSQDNFKKGKIVVATTVVLSVVQLLCVLFVVSGNK